MIGKPVSNPVTGAKFGCRGIVLPGSAIYEYAEEFAPLLSDAELTLYCMEQWDTGIPLIQPAEDLHGVWPNSSELLFSSDCGGIWLYEYTAVLDGQTLTGTGTTIARLPDE